MFSYLKKMIAPTQGTLSENNKDLFICTYNISAGRIIFTSKTEERSFQISKIYNFVLTGNNILSFCYTKNNYIYKSTSKLKDLFDLLAGKTDFSKLFEGSGNFYFLDSAEPKTVKLVVYKESIVIDDQIYKFKNIKEFFVDKKENKLFFTYDDQTPVIRFEDSFEFKKFLASLQIKDLDNQVFTDLETQNLKDFEEEIEESDENIGKAKISEITSTGKVNEIKNDGLLTAPDNLLFVSRGDALGIFNSSENGVTHKSTIINGLEDSLSKMRLFNNQILLQDKNGKDLKLLDLNKEKICEKYDTKSKLTDYFCDSNNCNAITTNSLMNLDFRTKEVVVAKSEYKTNTGFLIGSLKGNKIVVGSANGDIRFYDKVCKKAKELVKGYGDEVICIDQSGVYSVVTYKEYLLLCFDKKRIKLTLKPEHCAFINEEICFTPCKFSPDGERLLTSTGNYLISWKLSDILNNLNEDDLFVQFNYRIRRYDEKVIADNFNCEDPRTIYVVLPDDVKKTETNLLGSMENEMLRKKSVE